MYYILSPLFDPSYKGTDYQHNVGESPPHSLQPTKEPTTVTTLTEGLIVCNTLVDALLSRVKVESDLNYLSNKSNKAKQSKPDSQDDINVAKVCYIESPGLNNGPLLGGDGAKHSKLSKLGTKLVTIQAQVNLVVPTTSEAATLGPKLISGDKFGSNPLRVPNQTKLNQIRIAKPSNPTQLIAPGNIERRVATTLELELIA